MLIAGCAQLPLKHGQPAVSRAPEAIQAYYSYPAKPSNVTTTQLGQTDTYRHFMMEFPLSAQGFEPTEPVVKFEWFESTRPGKRPAIVLNPILGGDYPLERGIAKFFAKQGYHVAMIHRKTLKVSPEHPPEHLELLLRQGVVRIRQVVDWMEAHERVDPARMGSFGISMGGIAAVITAAVEPRLTVHVAALAGGSIPDILMSSRDKLLTRPMTKYMARNNMDKQTLNARLRESVRTDPLLLAPYVNRDRLFMIIALTDRTIGRANSLRLWRALGKPETVFLPTGHYTSYLALPWIKRASLKYFQRHLGK